LNSDKKGKLMMAAAHPEETEPQFLTIPQHPEAWLKKWQVFGSFHGRCQVGS